MLIVIYENESGALSSKYVDTAYGTSFPDDFAAANPGCRLLHVFDHAADMYSESSLMRDDFVAQAYRYGLKPDDYGRMFFNPERQILQIIGLRPRNRKYTVLLRNLTLGIRVKASPAFVRARLAEAPA